MKKLPVPAKKSRPVDTHMRMTSIMRDVIDASKRSIVPLKPKRNQKKKQPPKRYNTPTIYAHHVRAFSFATYFATAYYKVIYTLPRKLVSQEK
jgi:hypothetical protein